MYGMNTTTLTERGQVSMPSGLRKAARLEPGQSLTWHMISETEFRVTVARSAEIRGAKAAIGYARRFHGERVPTTEEALRDIREGESG